jgi:hypothetical protein
MHAVMDERLERAARRLRKDHDDDPVKAVHGAPLARCRAAATPM